MPEKEIYELKLSVKVDKDKAETELASLRNEFKKHGVEIEKITQKTNELTKVSEKQSGTFDKLFGGFRKLRASYLGIMAAIGAVIGVVTKSISEFEKAERQKAQLKTTLDGLNISYEQSKNIIEEQLKAISVNTKYTKDNTLETYNELLKLTGNVESSFKLLKIAMDVASGTGKSLTEVINTFRIAMMSGRDATVILGKEFGQLGIQGKNLDEMLTNLGIAFEDNRIKEQTLQKETKDLKDTFNDIYETIGSYLIPVFDKLLLPVKGFLGFTISGFKFVETLVKNLVDNIVRAGLIIKSIITRDFKEIENINKITNKSIEKNWEEFDKTVIDLNNKLFEKNKQNIKDYSNAVIQTRKDEVNKTEEIEKEKEALIKKFIQETGKQSKLSFEERIKLLDEEINRAKKLGIDRTIWEKYYQAQLTEIVRNETEQRFKVETELSELRLRQIQDNTEKEIETLKIAYEKDIQNYEQMLTNKSISDEEYIQLSTERTKAYESEKEKLAESFFGGYKGELDRMKEFTTSMTSELTGTFSNFFGGVIKGGKDMENAFDNILNNILNAFVNTLIRMQGEALAEGFMKSLSGLFGGGGLLGLGGFLGLFQSGGEIPKTGAYILHKGEKGMSPHGTGSEYFTTEKQQVINLNINTFDIRQIDRMHLEKIARNLAPALKKYMI